MPIQSVLNLQFMKNCVKCIKAKICRKVEMVDILIIFTVERIKCNIYVTTSHKARTKNWRILCPCINSQNIYNTFQFLLGLKSWPHSVWMLPLSSSGFGWGYTLFAHEHRTMDIALCIYKAKVAHFSISAYTCIWEVMDFSSWITNKIRELLAYFDH